MSSAIHALPPVQIVELDRFPETRLGFLHGLALAVGPRDPFTSSTLRVSAVTRTGFLGSTAPDAIGLRRSAQRLGRPVGQRSSRMT